MFKQYGNPIVTLQSSDVCHIRPFYCIQSLVTNISSFNKAWGVNNVESKARPWPWHHHWPWSFRLKQQKQFFSKTNHINTNNSTRAKTPIINSVYTWKALTATTRSPMMELMVEDFPTPLFPITRIVNVLTFYKRYKCKLKNQTKIYKSLYNKT